MDTDGLSRAELADRAGVTEAEVDHLAGLGILVPRSGDGELDSARFSGSDVQRIRLATACADAGLPLDGISGAIEAGRMSFAFLENASYRRWASRSEQTYAEVCRQSGIDFETLRTLLESMGFSPLGPDERIREDELEVVPLIQLAMSTGIIDEGVFARVGRIYADSLRRIAAAEAEVYHSSIEMPLLASGLEQRQIFEVAAQMGEGFPPLMDRALMGAYRRQQELAWMTDMVEHIEEELEAFGFHARGDRVPAMCFVDLAGYTRLTDEQGDERAAALAESLSILAQDASRANGGIPVKWLGDGVMFHFREPAGAVVSSLQLVEELPEAGLPPGHVGVASGPVVVQGADYFGRTVNMASRIAGHAEAGQVLVSESVAETARPEGVRFVDVGDAHLKGLAKPARLFEAVRS